MFKLRIGSLKGVDDCAASFAFAKKSERISGGKRSLISTKKSLFSELAAADTPSATAPTVLVDDGTAGSCLTSLGSAALGASQLTRRAMAASLPSCFLALCILLVVVAFKLPLAGVFSTEFMMLGTSTAL